MNKSSIKGLPVRFGDVWSLNSRHTFHCNDMLAVTGTYDLIYTDPPWDERVLQDFYRRAGLIPEAPFELFIASRVLHMQSLCPNGLIFIEFGVRTFPVVVDAFKRMRGRMLGEADCTYTSKRIRQKVACFTFKRYADADADAGITIPQGLHEWDICRTLLKLYSHPGQTMLEPFCGMGYQARIGMENGLTITGVELIPIKFTQILYKTKGDWTCQNRK